MAWRRWVSAGVGLALSATGALAQGSEGPTCAADRQKLEALLKVGDENLVRLFVGSLECTQVRDEGQRWLLTRQGNSAEAGDTKERARDLGHPRSGDTVIEDRIGAGDKAKFYKITTGDLAIISARVKKAPANLTLVIYDQDGKVLDETKSRNKDDEYVGDTAKPAGTYYVALLNPSRVVTSYDLVLNLVEPAPPYSHTDIAYDLTLGSGVTEFRTSFGDTTKFRYTAFNVPRAGLYKFTSRVLDGDPGVDIDVRIYKSAKGWTEIGRSERGPGEDEALVEMLAPGRHLLQLYRDAGERADVVATIAATTEVLAPDFEGLEIARNGEWRTMVRQKDGKKSCYSYTLATTFSPQNWRGRLPFLLLRVDEGEEDVFHTIDKHRFYGANRFWVASVSGGTSLSIPVLVKDDEPDVKTLEPCSQNKSELCVSNRGLTGLTQGRELTLKGTSADGRTTSVTYSLQGYRKSVEAMNSACDNEQRTGWLIRGSN